MAKLQVALDGDLESALKILAEVYSFIDIVEIGTPLIYREGMRAVQLIRETYPDLLLLADLKIMDAGEEEANIAFEVGANLITVLGVTNDNTMLGAVHSAQNHQGQIVVDMMQVANKVERGKQLLDMGCDVLCVHTAYDLQSSQESTYLELQELREQLPSAKLAIAGGVNFAKLDDILPYHPDIIVVGGAITGANYPADKAQKLYEWIKTYDN